MVDFRFNSTISIMAKMFFWIRKYEKSWNNDGRKVYKYISEWLKQ